MKLQVFNGGKSTRLDSHLISVNEGVEYTNIDVEPGSLTPLKDKRDLASTLLQYSFWFSAVSLWVQSGQERDYVEYKSILYFSEETTNPKKTSDGITFYDLGIVNPTSAPAVADGGAGNLSGTYQYLVTYYNSADGAESGPSPLSTEITVTSKRVDLTSIPSSTDPQVDQKRIYRIGGDLTLFTLVDTIANATTNYTDNLADTDVEGTILETQNYQPAPTGLKFLTENYSIFFGAIGDRLYFTPIAKPNAWPTLNFIDFDSDITAIGKVYNGTVVCTQFKSYIILGTNVNSFVKNILSSSQGCKKHQTMKQLSSGELLFVSNDGICSTTGSKVVVISKPKLGKVNLSVKSAIVYNEIYFLQKTDFTLLSVDTRYGLAYVDINADTDNLLLGAGILYGVRSNKQYQMFDDSNNLSLVYKSPNIIEGSYTELKNYKSIYVRAEGSLTFKIYLDEILVLTKSLAGIKTHELKIPSDLQDAYSIQFEITGTAIVKEIEFKPLARKSD